MELVLRLILCMTILNIIPWILLCFKRPDQSIHTQLKESDSALAQIMQVFMGKIQSLEEMADNFGGAAAPLDFGQIIGQILQQKMNGNIDNDYNRDSSGRYYGQEKEWTEITPPVEESELNNIG